MSAQPLISIVIPTYNRADLIAETVASIRAQTYVNWECIIVDDQSDDDTETILTEISKQDSRFQYLKRPLSLPKGGNVCRNIGLEQASGVYVQFFDSDDLMVPSMLEEKMQLTLEHDYDYVISKTANFQHPDQANIISKNENYYKFQHIEITHFNYVSQQLNWLTPDFLGKRSLIGDLRFNSDLPSGQEYNFYAKLTAKSVHAGVLDSYTTLRRLHDGSIRSKLQGDEKRLYKERMLLRRATYKELKDISPKEVVDNLFFNWLKATLDSLPGLPDFFVICFQLLKRGKISSLFWYKLHTMAVFVSGKGHFFRKKVLSSL